MRIVLGLDHDLGARAIQVARYVDRKWAVAAHVLKLKYGDQA
jgi:hypothetical protein